MDTRGAVDLSLLTTQVSMPSEEVLSSPDLERWADESGVGIPTSVWARVQLTRLAAASVLEARLLHVKASRLDAFGLVHDPASVTLQQLAPLQLIHKGTAGQAFELAVADAVAAQHREVTSLIRAGLRKLGLSGEGTLSMVVLGMEKVPPSLREVYWETVRQQLPRDGRIRTGLPGRPQHGDTFIAKMAEMTAQAMHHPRTGARAQVSRADHRDRYSQLSRADALVVCGSDLVAASLKINPYIARREAWRDVPLWITTGPEAQVTNERVNYNSLRSPRINVVLPHQGWFAVFRDALDAVDVALDAINRDRTWGKSRFNAETWDRPMANFRVSEAVAKTLWLHRTKSIAEVTEILGKTHAGLRDTVGSFDYTHADVNVLSLNVSDLVQGWHDASDDAQLVMTQQHLFRRLDGAELELVADPMAASD